MKHLPLSLLLVVICINTATSLTPCEVYTKDFECDAATTSHPFEDPEPEPEPDCGSNLVETTLNLFAEGDEAIDKQFEVLGKREAILMIGKTGTGKSTLSYFLAGNTSAMISYKTGPKKYLIKDCNGKIGGSGIISQTMFPDLLIDPLTDKAYYDYPGFFDTRQVCVEIANAYYMLKVARHIPKLKFILVVEHSTVGGRARDDFPGLLESVMNFIPSIENFGNGLAIIATKVGDQTEPDEDFIPYLEAYLNEILVDLPKVFSDNDLKKAEFIMNSLLSGDRIGVFRTPNDCGPLDSIDFMKKNKANLKNVIDPLEYQLTKPSDFGVFLSDNANLAIDTLRQNISAQIVESLELLTDNVNMNYECKQFVDCYTLISKMENLFSDYDFSNGYNDIKLVNGSIATLLNRTIGVFEILDKNNQTQPLIDSVIRDSGYLDFLKTLDFKTVDVKTLLVPLKEFYRNVNVGISNLQTQWTINLSDDLVMFADLLTNYFTRQYDCNNPITCTQLMTTLQRLYTDAYFINNYNYTEEWGSLKLYEIINHTTKIFYTFDNIPISANLTTSLNTFSTLLDQLELFHLDKVDAETFLVPFQSMHRFVDSEIETIGLDFTTVDVTKLLVPFRDFYKNLKIGISNLETKWTIILSDNMVLFGNLLTNDFTRQFQCNNTSECTNLITTLQVLYTDADFKNNYEYTEEWSGLTLNDVINRTTNIFYEFDNNIISDDLTTSLNTFSTLLDQLEMLDSDEVDVEKLILQMQSMQEFKDSKLETFGLDFKILNVTKLLVPLKDFYKNVKIGVSNLRTEWEIKLNNDLVMFANLLTSHFTHQFDCKNASECTHLLTTLQVLYTDADFLNNYNFSDEWSSLTLSEIINRATKIFYTFDDIPISADLTTSLSTLSTFLDQLELLDLNKVDFEKLFSQMQSMHDFLDTKLKNFGRDSYDNVQYEMKRFKDAVYEDLSVLFNSNDPPNTQRLLDNIYSLYTNEDFINGYNDISLENTLLITVVKRTSEAFLSLLNITVAPDITASLYSASVLLGYLEDLNVAKINISEVYSSMQVMHSDIVSDVTNLRRRWETDLDEKLKSFSDDVHIDLVKMFICGEPLGCDEIVQNIQVLSNNVDFKTGYTDLTLWKEMPLNSLANVVTELYVKLKGVQVSDGIQNSLNITSCYLDELQKSDKILVNLLSFAATMQDLHRKIIPMITKLHNDIPVKVQSLFESFILSLKQYILDNSFCSKETCLSVLNDFSALYENSDFNDGYKIPGTWEASSFSDVTIRLTTFNFSNFKLDSKQIAQLLSYSRNLDDLKLVDKSITVKVLDWIPKWQYFNSNVTHIMDTSFKPTALSYMRTALGKTYLAIPNNIFNLADVVSAGNEFTAIASKNKIFLATMETEFSKQLSVSSFLSKTLNFVVGLGYTGANNTLISDFNVYPYLNFFSQHTEYSTIIKSENVTFWNQPFVDFDRLVANENLWYTFLTSLFKDLSVKAIQVDDTGKLKDWWEINSPIKDNDNTDLKSLWLKLGNVPSMQLTKVDDAIKMLSETPTNRENKFKYLNSLLKTALEAPNPCKYIDETTLNCEGKFVSFSEVIAFLKPEADTIVVKALHTIFIDKSIIGLNYNSGKNLHIIIIAPKWVTEAGKTLNLNGAVGNSEQKIGGTGGSHGNAGGVGGNAGQFYYIGDDFTTGFPTATVDAGNGGKGQDGENGANGGVGTIKSVSYNYDKDDKVNVIVAGDCTASSGKVRLASYFDPNTCSSPTKSRECNAGNNGVTFYIPGTKGSAGTNGGDGGQSGIGGFSGTVYRRKLGNGIKDIPGIASKPGAEGEGGIGGSAGRDGYTYNVKIDDIGGSYLKANKRCEYQGSSTSYGASYSKGSNGKKGGSDKNLIHPIKREFDPQILVLKYITEFNTFASKYKSNEFLTSLLKSFTERMETIEI